MRSHTDRLPNVYNPHYQRIAKATNCYQVLPLATKTTTGKNLLRFKCGSLKRVKLRTLTARTNSDLLGQTRTRESGVKVTHYRLCSATLSSC